jgi:hypothetical protein
VPRLRILGAIPPLLQYAFMALLLPPSYLGFFSIGDKYL